MEVQKNDVFDLSNNPQVDGLYDIRMGPTERDDKCGTCGLEQMPCAGHHGRIQLPVAAYHPLHLKVCHL